MLNKFNVFPRNSNYSASSPDEVVIWDSVQYFPNVICNDEVREREPSIIGTLPCQMIIKLSLQWNAFLLHIRIHLGPKRVNDLNRSALNSKNSVQFYSHLKHPWIIRIYEVKGANLGIIYVSKGLQFWYSYCGEWPSQIFKNRKQDWAEMPRPHWGRWLFVYACFIPNFLSIWDLGKVNLKSN